MTKSKDFIMPEFSAMSQIINNSLTDSLGTSVVGMAEAISKARVLGMSEFSAMSQTINSSLTDSLGTSVVGMAEAISKARVLGMSEFSAMSQIINNSTMDSLRTSVVDMSKAISKARALGMSDLSGSIQSINSSAMDVVRTSLIDMSEAISEEIKLGIPDFNLTSQLLDLSDKDILEFTEDVSYVDDILSLESLQKEIESLKKVSESPNSDTEKILKLEAEVNKLSRLVNITRKKKILNWIFWWTISFLLSPIQSNLESQYIDKVVNYFHEQYINIEQEILLEEILYDRVDEIYKKVKKETLLVKREKHNQSETIGYLYEGQIIESIKQKKDWTKVLFTLQPNDIVEGWVYTRYLVSLV